jgi:putative transposase
VRTLYFSNKDLDLRLKEWRQQFWKQVEEEQLEMAKRRVQEALGIEFREAIGAQRYERSNARKLYRGGYRYRDLQTWGGRLCRVRVPKANKGYKFKLLKPWTRHVEKFGEAVYRAFVYGMSDRKVAKFFEALYGKGTLSPAGVSVIYQNMTHDIDVWHKRPIEDRYRFLFLDAMWQSVRQCHKNRRAILAVMGVRHDGMVELIDFRVETGESASAWGRFVQSLFERGLIGKRLELIVHDGCQGLMDALRWVWPHAKTQQCAVHALRELGDAIRARHIRYRVLREASRVYKAKDRQQAQDRARALAQRWGRCESRAIRNFMNKLDRTLVYMDFPESLRHLLKSTNLIERHFREWRRRLRAMGALPNCRSCDRILFALALEFNSQQKRISLSFQKSELLLT